MSVLGAVTQFNRFMPALRKLGALDLVRERAAACVMPTR